jgi:hypothetical protein
MNTDKSVRTPEEIAKSISLADQIAHVEYCAEEAKHVGYAERAMELAVLRTLNSHPALVEALTEQANFLASLHTTYRHDGRLAARIEAHLTAIRAALSLAQEGM